MLSYAEIAAKLYLAPRTVERHLALAQGVARARTASPIARVAQSARGVERRLRDRHERVRANRRNGTKAWIGVLTDMRRTHRRSAGRSGVPDVNRGVPRLTVVRGDAAAAHWSGSSGTVPSLGAAARWRAGGRCRRHQR